MTVETVGGSVSGGGGGGPGDKKKKEKKSSKSSSILKKGTKIAATALSIGGGPEDPAGDGIAISIEGGTLVIAGGLYVYENWNGITKRISSIKESISNAFERLFSKGGKQNKYDNQLSPLSNETLQQLEKVARAASNTQLLRKIKTEWKKRGEANKQKRQSIGY